jgi:hypothetical protein
LENLTLAAAFVGYESEIIYAEDLNYITARGVWDVAPLPQFFLKRYFATFLLVAHLTRE